MRAPYWPESGRHRPVGFAVLLIAGACALSCVQRGCPPGKPPKGASAAGAPVVYRSEQLPFPAPLPLCASAGELASHVTAQLLVDTSGSMRGFVGTRVLDRAYRWIASTASGLGGQGTSVRLARLASFNRPEGMRTLPNESALLSVDAHGDTNLDQAVAEAPSANITAILTDGIPYAGDGGSGNCASGVNTGCVARGLIDYVSTRSGAGLWVVPLVGQFDGPFFTEGQAIPPGLTSTTIIDTSIKKAFPSSEVTVQINPRAVGEQAAGKYRGPKILLLLILADDVGAGRAFVRGLLERAGLAQVSLLDENLSAFNNRQTKLAVLSPVEVFPGYLPPVAQLQAAVDGSPEGTIELPPRLSGNALTFEVGCLKGVEGRLRYRLDLALGTAGQACPRIQTLPTVSLRMAPEESLDDTTKGQLGLLAPEYGVVPAVSGMAGPHLEGHLTLACDGASGLECANQPVSQIALSATLSYARAAELLGQPGADGGAIPFLATLSTESLPNEPFKVLGLRALLTHFMRETPDQARPIPLTSFGVCQRQQ